MRKTQPTLNIIAQYIAPRHAQQSHVPPERLEAHLADCWRNGAAYATVNGKLVKRPEERAG